MNYGYAAYGANPNYGRNANAENGWGAWKWPVGVPDNLMGVAVYGDVKLQVRKELVELTYTLMRVSEDKYKFNLYGPNEKPPAGWCWGYSNRAISGTNTASNHSKGRAVDLNAPDNPYTSPLVCNIPPALVNTWEQCGFYWGGRYSGSKDAMHFEYCWTPNDVPRHVILAKAALGVIPKPKPEPTPEEDDMAPASVLKDVQYGWLYSIAPNHFEVITLKDGNHGGTDQYKTGKDAGLYAKTDPLVLNNIQIASMRAAFCPQPPRAGIYDGEGPDGPKFI